MNRPGEDFRWPVAVADSVSAPAEDLWEIVAMPGNLELCHPFCARNPVIEWPGEGSRDEVHYLNGLVLHRRFCRWIDGVGYDLEIGTRGGRTSYVSWRILPGDRSESVLEITVFPHILQEIPAWLRWLPHRLRIRPMLTTYLSAVVRGFDWYVTHGGAVPRNQFGPHPWFSIPAHSAGAA